MRTNLHDESDDVRRHKESTHVLRFDERQRLSRLKPLILSHIVC